MAAAATPTTTLKPLTLPSIFLTTKPPNTNNNNNNTLLFLSKTKPIKLNLIRTQSFSLKPKTHFSLITTYVAQTSDWAQQEEEEGNGERDINTTLTMTEETEQEEEEEEMGGGVGGSWDVPEGELGDGVGESEGGESGFVVEEEDPPEDAKVFVGNLPYDVDSQRLAELFEQAGVVEIAEVIYNRETDTSRGFGFVTMSTVEEADKAVETFHRYDLDGRLLTVNKAAPRGQRPERPPRFREPGFRIYVGNLPWEVEDARLEQVFSEHGKVVDARVVYDRDSGRSRGFGFVTMSSETEMNDAIAALDGQNLDGRAIRVNVAEERPRRSF